MDSINPMCTVGIYTQSSLFKGPSLGTQCCLSFLSLTLQMLAPHLNYGIFRTGNKCLPISCELHVPYSCLVSNPRTENSVVWEFYNLQNRKPQKINTKKLSNTTHYIPTMYTCICQAHLRPHLHPQSGMH